jgi:hypothetical protein
VHTTKASKAHRFLLLPHLHTLVLLYLLSIKCQAQYEKTTCCVQCVVARIVAAYSTTLQSHPKVPQTHNFHIGFQTLLDNRLNIRCSKLLPSAIRIIPSGMRVISTCPNQHLTSSTMMHTTPPSLPSPPISPPFHSISSLPNFRTIGGWPISPTTHVRPLIYRGSDTTHLTPTDIHALLALNIRTDFDLRSASQVAKLGYRDLSEWGIRRVWCPVFGEEGKGDVERRYGLYASEDVAVCFGILDSWENRRG